MHIDVVRPHELSPSDLDNWRDVQRDNAWVDSPFLSADFALAVAEVRPHTRVAVLSDGAEAAGFFAYELGRWRQGTALATGLSDLQGVVASPELGVDMGQVMRGCDLDLYTFDHLLAGQRDWLKDLPSRFSSESSPALDLSDGFGEYARQQRITSKSLFQSITRKRRKLEREHGPMRLTFHEPDHQLLDDVLKWKSDQYRRTGRRDRFADVGTRALVHHLLDLQTGTFGAPLTVLYAGDAVVAAHLGLRSRRTLAWWFPVYNPSFAAYSPGLLLCHELARAMPERGLSVLDLGKGDESYKQRFANTGIPLLEGSIATKRAAQALHTARTWPARRLTRVVLESPRLRQLARRTLAEAGRLRGAA